MNLGTNIVNRPPQLQKKKYYDSCLILNLSNFYIRHSLCNCHPNLSNSLINAGVLGSFLFPFHLKDKYKCPLIAYKTHMRAALLQ